MLFSLIYLFYSDKLKTNKDPKKAIKSIHLINENKALLWHYSQLINNTDLWYS
jgi:catabolite regulation protein CreA